MCLERRGRFKPTREGIGYKFILIRDNKYYSANTGSYRYRKSGWMEAKDEGQSKKDIGFHIYDNQSTALSSGWPELNKYGGEFVLFKVKYENYHTGYGDGLIGGSGNKIIVAKRMRILEEIKL